MFGLALALGSSACWGTADFIGGVQARRLPLLRVVLTSQAVGLAGVAVLVIARGAAPPDYLRLLPAVGGGLAGIMGLSAFYRALSIGTMSIVAPISATGVVVPVVVGIATGDRPAAVQLAGILAATIGVILASREEDETVDRRGVGREEGGAADGRGLGRGEGGVADGRGVGRASVVLALIGALGFGGFFVGVRASARTDVLWTLFAARGAGVAALGGASLALRPPGRPAGRTLLALTAVGLLDLAANGLYAIATRHGLLSVVAVAASLYPLATVVLARVILGERVRRVQEVGVVTAVAGVALIAAG